MRRLVNRSNAASWIAEEDGSLVGFAIAELTQRAEQVQAYIQTIEVLAEQRGRGVGGELLNRLETSAHAVTATSIWLHVDTANSGAIRLYEAHGYLCEGRQEDFYTQGNAALIYRKQLVPTGPRAFSLSGSHPVL
jgi:ribosomal protein S18 acetylase RimI-like enzyme